jgi:heme-degrading monooxygenase HmoA
MYGTVARIYLKPGVAAPFLTRLRELNAEREPGFVAEYLYQMDADPDTYYLAVAFESKEAYYANSIRPETHARYVQLMEFAAAEPEWHDGEIVFIIT